MKLILLLLCALLLAGCVDTSHAIKLCQEKNLTYYAVKLNCNVICIDAAGEKHIYDNACSLNINTGGK